MSQYVSFYISDGEQFIFLDEFSRSTEIYKAMANFGYAPYEKVRQVSSEELQTAVNAVLSKVEATKDSISYCEQMIKHVQACSNIDLDERLKAISDYEDQIDGLRSEIEWYNTGADTLRVYANIASNADYHGNALYAGIDISEPTAADIL